MTPPKSLQLCLAIETNGDPAAHLALPSELAGQLAELIARDLRQLFPGLQETDLAVVGAHFDPVELLQPRWRLHQSLSLLTARAPRPGQLESQLVGFGTPADGTPLPENLQPADEYVGGPLRLVPIVITGSGRQLLQLSDSLEDSLLEEGMTSSETALWIKEHFGIHVEHCRYMTGWDLAAMMRLQYRQAQLDWLWPIIEENLYGAMENREYAEGEEPLVRVNRGEVFLAVDTNRHGTSRLRADTLEMRSRQIAALLSSHGITVNVIPSD